MGKIVMTQRISDSIVVTGLGMISSIGRDVVTSCASARAGITRESELDYFSVLEKESIELLPVVGHAITGFSEGFLGLGRLIRLGSAALSDLLNYVDLKDTEWSKTGFFLNLSSGYNADVADVMAIEENEFAESHKVVRSDRTRAVEEKYGASIIPTLLRINGISIPEKNQQVYFKDHHGIIAAVDTALVLLKKGMLERCIIGGIDSYLESQTLEVLNDLCLLKTAEHQDGFLPGEAAAFFMIERHDRTHLRNGKIEAMIEAPAITSESCHRFSKDVSNGVALSEAIEKTLAQVKKPVNRECLIIGNLNGDQWRAKEWGTAMSRTSARYPIFDQPQWHPAVCFGETGAATGAIAICMGTRGLARDYAKKEQILIWMSSHDGNKGSIMLHNPDDRIRA